MPWAAGIVGIVGIVGVLLLWPFGDCLFVYDLCMAFVLLTVKLEGTNESKKKKESFYHWQITTIIKNILRCLDTVDHFFFHHIYQEANMVENWLLMGSLA